MFCNFGCESVEILQKVVDVVHFCSDDRGYDFVMLSDLRTMSQICANSSTSTVYPGS